MQPTLALEATAFTTAQLLDAAQPQAAVAGRSNVGKSSLINALAGRKKLAKTSADPGKTRSVNYYRILPWNSLLVDLPGYGYARSSREEQAKWTELVNHYFNNTPGLLGLMLLLDCRLPPQESDLRLVAFAGEHRLPLLPVLTKADACPRSRQVARQREWTPLLDHAPLLFSATRRMGIEALWQEMAALYGLAVL